MRTSLLLLSMLLLPASALAQTNEPPKPANQDEWSAAAGGQPKKSGGGDEGHDGVRFRFGVAAGGGFWAGTGALNGFSAGLGGASIRLGVQINDLIGVYAQPHFAFGVASINRASGVTGEATMTGLVDLTLAHRFFIAAGGGAAVLNNPAGGALHFRLGGYPLMGFKATTGRYGLSGSVDMRIFFLSGGITVISPMFMIGYDLF